MIKINWGSFGSMIYICDGVNKINLFSNFFPFVNKNIWSEYILPIIGYIVQAMFSISVITVAPIFYIAIGLTINRENSWITRVFII